MKIIKTKTDNTTVIEFADGTTVLWSYTTPVAAFVPGRGWVKTVEKHSTTTSKHVNQFLAEHASHHANVESVPQHEIFSLVSGL